MLVLLGYIRVNCPHCSEPVTVEDDLKRLAESYGIEMKDDMVRAGRGCVQCNGIGFKGRTAIHELMVMSPELRSLIETGAPDSDLERVAREQGMRLLVEEALDRVARGTTTMEEVRRVTVV